MNPKQLFWLVILIPTLALLGCEGETGPQGPAGTPGEDGIDGVDGTSLNVCLECHNDSEFVQISLEYLQSGHKAGNYVGYAGGRASCAACHSKQGFIEFAAIGDVAGDISDPAAIDCATCHTVHSNTSVWGIRLDGGVPLLGVPGYTLDFGDDSNLCANCHQSRRAEPNVAAPGDSFAITSTHYGPHHGPQANVLEGVGFAEIAGDASYPPPSSGSGHLSAGVTCVDCHMATYTDGMGGHTWNPSTEYCTGCHTDPNEIPNYQAATLQKLDDLRDILVNLGVVEYVPEDEAYEPIVGTYPMIQAQAFFNWIGLEEDRSLGAHNPDYTDALLDNTIQALTP